MKLYISGQITGLDYQDAFDAFERCEAHIAAHGHEPINPMKSDGEVPRRKWVEYIAEDLLILDECDGIFMLPNWRNSKGARLEHYFCELLGKHVFYAASEL